MLRMCMRIVLYYINIYLIILCVSLDNRKMQCVQGCIIRNLSYRLENEMDPQEGADNVLDQEWEKEQRKELEEDIQIIQR